MIETMGQCLRAWMDEEQLTASGVAQLTGYRSKTTVARILREASEEKALIQFCDSMRPHLSPEWWERFEKALLVSRTGLDHFRMFEMLDRSLFSSRNGKKHDQPMEERGDTNERLDILGCAWQETNQLLAAMKMQNPGLRIRRYLTEEEILSSPELMEQILQHITDPTWQVYLLDQRMLQSGKLSWNICLHSGIPGKAGEMFMLGQGQWMDFPLEKASVDALLTHLEDCESSAMYRNEQLDSSRDYISFTKQCYEMERGRKMAAVRPTPAIQMIPFAIARDSFQDYLAENPGPMAVAKDSLIYVHEKRVRNFYHRDKGTTLILSEQGLKDFARTGRLSDQFYSFRPFHKSEMEKIFRRLIEFSRQSETNLLVRGGSEGVLSLEVYEGQGAVIYPSSSSYSAQGKYRELRLWGEGLEQLCWSYVTNLSGRENVDPAEKTLRTLLIRSASMTN